jgi:hypothetical protein
VVEQSISRVSTPRMAAYAGLALGLAVVALVAGISAGLLARGCHVTPAWAYPWMGGRIFVEQLLRMAAQFAGCALR